MPAYCPFPVEILDAFIDALGANSSPSDFSPFSVKTWSALATCLLVSRSFRARARVHIFRHLYLIPSPRCTRRGRSAFSTFVSRLCALTVKAPSVWDDISPLIRRLDIPSSNYYIDNPDIIVILARLSAKDCHLHHLGIGNYQDYYADLWDGGSSAFCSAFANLLPSLTILDLHNVSRFPSALIRGRSFDRFETTNSWGIDVESGSTFIGQPSPQASTFIRQLDTGFSSLDLFRGQTVVVEEMLLTLDVAKGNVFHQVHDFLHESAESLVSLTFAIPNLKCLTGDVEPFFPLEYYHALKQLSFTYTDTRTLKSRDLFGSLYYNTFCLDKPLSSIAHVLESSQRPAALEQITMELALDYESKKAFISALVGARTALSRLDEVFSRSALADVARVVLKLTLLTKEVLGLEDVLVLRDAVKEELPKLSSSGRFEVQVVLSDKKEAVECFF